MTDKQGLQICSVKVRNLKTTTKYGVKLKYFFAYLFIFKGKSLRDVGEKWVSKFSDTLVLIY